MEISVNDCTLKEAIQELEFQRVKYPNACFSGKGNGQVVIKLYEDIGITYEKSKQMQNMQKDNKKR